MQTKMYALLVALLASASFVGCTSDEDATGSGTLKQLSFSAVADAGRRPSYVSGRMKTQLHPNEGNSVTFCSGDAISVFDGTTSQNKRFATKESGASVTFYGAAPESETYTALYPYQEGASISGGVISAELPATQYAQSGTTFDPQAVLSVASTTNTEMTFGFKNVCGLVKVTTTEPLAKIVFKGNNGEKVAGNVSITVAAAPTATGGAESIELKPISAATSFAAGTYYISVLPQAFEDGFTLEAYKTSSSATADYALNIDTPVEVERSQILNVGKMSEFPTVDANGHEYVDLGIEIEEGGKTYKLLWATMNVGASAPEKFGDYFAWGETEPYYDAETGWSIGGSMGTVFNCTWKTTPKDYKRYGYDWVNYKWCEGTDKTLTKYNNNATYGTVVDNKTQLELNDDAARQNWGGDWVMPTVAEFQALKNNTTYVWTDDYNNTGVKGHVFTNKSDASKSIFLPAAGCIYKSVFTGILHSTDETRDNGYYWSSSLRTEYSPNAYFFRFELWRKAGYSLPSVVLAPEYSDRYYGRTVRPVLRVAK